jgi:hypothetical protein
MGQVGGKRFGGRGDPSAAPGPSPTGASLSRLASRGRQFGPRGSGQTARDGDISTLEARHRVLVPVGIPKRGEPQVRLQDATSLQVDARSKPSKPGGTARAERVQAVAGLGRRSGASSPKSGREWTRADRVDGGAILGQPQERRPDEGGVERVKATCKVAFAPPPMKASKGL